MVLKTSKILEIGDWLIQQALAEKPLEPMLEGLANKLNHVGVPIDRCRMTWSTLHPLFEAETVLWTSGRGIETKRFVHQEEESQEYLRSPIKYMLDHDLDFLRGRLDVTGALAFDLFEELRADGFTDLINLRTNMFMGRSVLPLRADDLGLYVTWATRAPGGFHDTVVETLKQLQRYMSLVCKLGIYPRLITSVADTYLGPTIAREVLGGRIRLGSGSQVRALVWLSDLRNSTGLAEDLSEDCYLTLLNDYFDCTGRAAMEAGGEILAFIGDAVLAIFPIQDGKLTQDAAIRKGIAAARTARGARRTVNARRREAGDVEFDFGVAMCVGEVRLGNIGIRQRLSFSVIGPSVNEAERIEKETKRLGVPVLATSEVVDVAAAHWRRVGSFTLRGTHHETELFGLLADDTRSWA
ncbi:adenylate/guanylate cyclase domain-containing protein [Aureimonas phyllosphaerae]|uniref:adenylate/guanylate cyclase domain-containing protein n=1 Tax=Aureimonas phyllosphaerae TaxID=1166078 RepID=UPI003A5C66AE